MNPPYNGADADALDCNERVTEEDTEVQNTEESTECRPIKVAIQTQSREKSLESSRISWENRRIPCRRNLHVIENNPYRAFRLSWVRLGSSPGVTRCRDTFAVPPEVS